MIINKGKDKYRIDWLRLIRSNYIGAKTFWDLINIYGSPTIAIEQLQHLLKKGVGKRKIEIATSSSIEAELNKAENFGAHIITAFDELYPEKLKSLPDAPPVLTVKGNINLLKEKKCIAVVGARNASSNGCSFAKKIARELGEKEYTIVSGLAKGIDAATHESSIATGAIGVIAGGIDNIYPEGNRKLYHLLYDQGAVITEFPFGFTPMANHFPQRNRVISGLSEAVIVIEAAIRSGTLITARFALEQGREVFAVPGFPLDPRSQGTNSLIKQGAYLLEATEDIIEVIEGKFVNRNEDLPSNISVNKDIADFVQGENEEELERWKSIVIRKLSYIPCLIEDIIEQTGIPTAILNRIIVELEIVGKVERLYGNKIVLIC